MSHAARWAGWLRSLRTGPVPLGASGPAPAVTTVPAGTLFPAAALDISVELQLAGTWTDVTTDGSGNTQVYSRDSVSLSRGRANEAALADNSSLRLTFNNRDGKFSPRNPRSAYYGLIGRNTPIRVSVRPHLQAGVGLDVVDTFTRTVTDTNWGISESGPSWVAGGTLPDNFRYSVDGSAAHLTLPVPTFTTGCYLDDGAGGPAWVDFDMAVTFTAPLATGASLAPVGIITHVDPVTLNSGPFVQVLVTTANEVKVRAFDYGGIQIDSTLTVAGLTHAGTGTPLRVRVRTAGRHLMMRVWDPAGTEPTDWHLVVEDTTRSFDPGSIFLFGQRLTSNTNSAAAITYDDLSIEAVEPRFCGEVANWPPRWTPGGQDVWVQMEAAGILRRLNQGTSPARSPMVRFVQAQPARTVAVPARAEVVAYWPLEDGQLATEGAALVGAHPLTLFPSAGADQYFGQGTLAPWLTNGVALYGLDELFGYVDWPAGWLPANGWAIDWIRAGSESSSESAMIVRTASMQWDVRFNPSTQLIKVTTPDAVSHTASAAAVFDGSMHHIRFECRQSGANISYDAYIDGANFITGSYLANTLEGIQYLDFQDLLQHTTDFTMAHLVVWDRAPEAAVTTPTLANTVAAAFGHDAEPAATRIERLCSEEGIPLRIPGPYNLDLTTSFPCGVQRTASTMDLIRAAEATDGGVLFEPRDFVGLTYRLRSQMYNQTPALALDYTGDGHVAPPLEPTDDDQSTRNDVTVTRRFGQSAQVEQTTGPLSTSAPPDGVGRYDTSLDLDLSTDQDAADEASWRVHLGTVDEARFPKVNLNLANTGMHAEQVLLGQMLRLDVGDRLTIENPPDWLPPRTIDQLGQGFAESFAQFQWTIGVNCSPASPWAIATVESMDEFTARVDTDGSTLDADATDTATSLSVASSAAVWVDSATYPADFPFDISVAGVRVTVTAITGTASPQAFTVVRSVDGFDIALPAGSAVELWTKTYVGL